MITHYGLFWSERDVYWGRQNSKGELLGREKPLLERIGAPKKEERSEANNYRDFVGLYCLYANRELIYVGEVGLATKGNLFQRLKEHRKTLSGRWDRFSWFGRKSCDGQCSVKEALAQLEATVIAVINPGHNKQSGTFAKAIQVHQVPHGDSEGDLETKIDRLTEQVKALVLKTEVTPTKSQQK
jgi:hypothetical protein